MWHVEGFMYFCHVFIFIHSSIQRNRVLLHFIYILKWRLDCIEFHGICISIAFAIAFLFTFRNHNVCNRFKRKQKLDMKSLVYVQTWACWMNFVCLFEIETHKSKSASKTFPLRNVNNHFSPFEKRATLDWTSARCVSVCVAFWCPKMCLCCYFSSISISHVLA